MTKRQRIRHLKAYGLVVKRTLFELTFSVCLIAGTTTHAHAAPAQHHGKVQTEDTIKVSGVTVLTKEQVVIVLTPFSYQNLSKADIQDAAKTLTKAVRAAGAFMAKVYVLPPLKPHEVRLQVVEGRLAKDGILLGHESKRVHSDIIIGTFQSAIKEGQVVTAKAYERGILLTNDLPGLIGSDDVLEPADKVGETRFKTFPIDDKPIEKRAYVDNFGSNYSGRYRTGGRIQFNSPTGHAERIRLDGYVTNRSSYFLSAEADFFLHPNGLRGGGDVSYLNYNTSAELNDQKGDSLSLSPYLRYPIIRSRARNLYSELRYTYSAMKDSINTGTVDDRVVNTVNVRIWGNSRDDFGGGGISNASIEAYIGNVNLDNFQPYKLQDQQTANTQGRFARAYLDISRLQRLSDNWESLFEIQGQIASKRMDASQSLSFGGPYDFAGYHAGEISGDEGYNLHADIRYNFPKQVLGGNLQVSAYYTFGQINTDAISIVAGVPTPGVNVVTYDIQSAGFGFYQVWKKVVLHGALGWRVNNQIPDQLLENGNSTEGWLQLSYAFD